MNNKHQALPEHELLTHKSFIRNLNLFDWAFALLIAVGAFYCPNPGRSAHGHLRNGDFVGEWRYCRFSGLVFQTDALVYPFGRVLGVFGR